MSKDIAENLLKVTNVLSNYQNMATTTILEELSGMLEELRTLLVLNDSQAEDAMKKLEEINKAVVKFDPTFDSINLLEQNIAKKKDDLSKLEILCNLLENSRK